jgi:LuxR family maltose regulon positive regulatory protein
LLGLAHISYQWNDLEMARQQAQEMLELGQYFSLEGHEVHATLMLTRIQLAQGQTTAAQQRLAALLSRISASLPHDAPQLYHAILTMQARVALTVGDLATVQRWVNDRNRRKEAGYCMNCGATRCERRENGCNQHREVQPIFSYDYEQEELLVARWLHAQGKHEEALCMLERLLDVAQEAGHIHHALEIRVALALVYAERKQMSDARQLLREVLPQGLAGNYLRLFLDAGEEMAAVLRSLVPHLQDKTLLAYLQVVLRAFSQEGGRTSLVEPLSPQELRVLRLLAANRSNAEIARELVVSVNTVRTQVQSIYRKLDVHNRSTAAEVARRLQLL